jgi:hypothetical protein
MQSAMGLRCALQVDAVALSGHFAFAMAAMHHCDVPRPNAALGEPKTGNPTIVKVFRA